MEKPKFPDYSGGLESKEESTVKETPDEDVFEYLEGEDSVDDEEETETEDTESKTETKEKPKESTKEDVKAKAEDEKLKEHLIQYLAGEDGQGTTKVKVKGKEYDLADLTPDEIKQWFSLGGRAWEVMEDNAKTRKDLEKDREILNRGAEQVNELMKRYGDVFQGKSAEVTLPEALKPNDLDNDNERSLREIAAQQYKEIELLKQRSAEATYTQAEQGLFREIENLQKEYACGSPEEVIAVLSANPNINPRDVMEASHKHYSSDAYFKKICDIRPDLVRGLKEDGVKEFLAKKGQVKRVAVRKSASTASSKVTEKKIPTPKTFDEIEAQSDFIKRHIEQMMEGQD